MQLRMFVDAGFGKRVMFGSDQLSWPGVIEAANAIINDASFLTPEQKRDILYGNAVRFLRLDDDRGSQVRPWPLARGFDVMRVLRVLLTTLLWRWRPRR